MSDKRKLGPTMTNPTEHSDESPFTSMYKSKRNDEREDFQTPVADLEERILVGPDNTIPVGLWISGPAGMGKSLLIYTCIRALCMKLFGKDVNVNSHVLYRSSNNDFYLRNRGDKTPPLFLVFDDICATSGGALGVGEFLRLISVGDKQLNIKGSQLSGQKLKAVISIANTTLTNWVETYNGNATRNSKSTVSYRAVARRFHEIDLNDPELLEMAASENIPTEQVFAHYFHEFVQEFLKRAIQGKLPNQLHALEVEQRLHARSMEILNRKA
jgi:hypothetical protein